ncbi:MAG: hypothetical protein ACFBSF_10250 [Leptolyngbyaceae cyanobacterium]
MVDTITRVSNFELLVRPIVDSPASPNRTIIQGYFLTIANPSLSNLRLSLNFLSATPDFSSGPFLAFWDFNGNNQNLSGSLSSSSISANFEIDLPGLETGLFLLQPDTNPAVLGIRNIEVRGFVSLSIVSATPSAFGGESDERPLLLSAQQRGTFLPEAEGVILFPPNSGDYDQLAYSLPIPNPEVTLKAGSIVENSAFALQQTSLLETLRENPNLLSSFTRDPLAQQIAAITDQREQRRMLDILLERFQDSLDESQTVLDSSNL